MPSKVLDEITYKFPNFNGSLLLQTAYTQINALFIYCQNINDH